MCKPRIMHLDCSFPSGKQPNKTLLIKLLARRWHQVQNGFDCIWNLYGTRDAIKHQHAQMWMFPSCLSAAFMASYKRPSLHSRLCRKQEVAPPCLAIQPGGGREILERTHEFTASVLHRLPQSDPSQARVAGHRAPVKSPSSRPLPAELSAGCCRRRCDFSL